MASVLSGMGRDIREVARDAREVARAARATATRLLVTSSHGHAPADPRRPAASSIAGSLYAQSYAPSFVASQCTASCAAPHRPLPLGAATHSRPAQRPTDVMPCRASDVDVGLVNSLIFEKTNLYRTTARNPKGEPLNLAPFRSSSIAAQAATGHSIGMRDRDFYDHDEPPNRTNNLRYRMTEAGLPKRCGCSENIDTGTALAWPEGRPHCMVVEGDPHFQRGKTIDFQTKQPIPNMTYDAFAEYVVKRWMDSPGHYANIMNPESTDLGVGVAFSHEASRRAPLVYHATQNFHTALPSHAAQSTPTSSRLPPAASRLHAATAAGSSTTTAVPASHVVALRAHLDAHPIGTRLPPV